MTDLRSAHVFRSIGERDASLATYRADLSPRSGAHRGEHLTGRTMACGTDDHAACDGAMAVATPSHGLYPCHCDCHVAPEPHPADRVVAVNRTHDGRVWTQDAAGEWSPRSSTYRPDPSLLSDDWDVDSIAALAYPVNPDVPSEGLDVVFWRMTAAGWRRVAEPSRRIPTDLRERMVRDALANGRGVVLTPPYPR